jgi:PAS domain-containing protein
MLITVATADSFLRPLIQMAAETGLERLTTALEQVNAPVYVTDAEGVVIDFNSA